MTTKEDQNITKPGMAGDFQTYGGESSMTSDLKGVHKIPIEGWEYIKGAVTLKAAMSDLEVVGPREKRQSRATAGPGHE